MFSLLSQLHSDEAGFVVSAELVLIATIAALSMIVGVSELAKDINQDLKDAGSAFGAVQQMFDFDGLTRVDGSSDGIDSRSSARNRH